jgi:hypothetical protein
MQEDRELRPDWAATQQIPGQPALHSETLSQKKQTKQKYMKEKKMKKGW